MQGVHKHTRYQNKCGYSSLLQMKVVDHLHLGGVMLINSLEDDVQHGVHEMLEHQDEYDTEK